MKSSFIPDFTDGHGCRSFRRWFLQPMSGCFSFVLLCLGIVFLSKFSYVTPRIGYPCPSAKSVVKNLSFRSVPPTASLSAMRQMIRSGPLPIRFVCFVCFVENPRHSRFFASFAGGLPDDCGRPRSFNASRIGYSTRHPRPRKFEFASPRGDPLSWPFTLFTTLHLYLSWLNS